MIKYESSIKGNPSESAFVHELVTQFEVHRLAALDVTATDFLKPKDLLDLQDHILNLYKNNFFKKSAIGRHLHVEENRRGDFIYWLNSNTQCYYEKYCLDFLEEIRKIMNREFYLGLNQFEAHWTVYPPGTSYEKHVDAFKSKGVGYKRKYTLILYLNSKYHPDDHGELVVYDNNNHMIAKVEPRFGHMVCFMSTEFPHEVLKCDNHERVSLTAWFLQSEP